MTQEQKDLLLKDLCCRLPYGIYGNYLNSDGSLSDDELLRRVKIGYHDLICADGRDGMVLEGFLKPYLFPLSSMTEEQTKEVYDLIYQGISESVDETNEWLKTRKENELRPITLIFLLNYRSVIDWCNKNHFDYRGLIPMELAIDCTNLNIY